MPKTQTKPRIQVRILSKPPVYAVDGHAVNLKDGIADVIFFQVANKNDKEIAVNGVSSLRMTTSQLQQFVKVANKLLEDQEKTKKTLK